MHSLSRSIGKYTLGLVLVLSLSHGAAASPQSSVTRKELKAQEHSQPSSWAIGLAASPSMFGGSSIVPGRTDTESLGLSLQAEYQPGLLQRYGVLGIGPVFAAYPISQLKGATSNFFSVWSVGGEARYQFRFAKEQMFVPSIGLECDQMHYSFVNGHSGNLLLAGPTVGLQFLLNRLDREHADALYEATGISRTYITAEARVLSGDNGDINPSGASWFLGLTEEF
jgi:hypothetical protein